MSAWAECQDCGEPQTILFTYDDGNPYGKSTHEVCGKCYDLHDNAEPSDAEIYGSESASERDEQSQWEYLNLK